MSVYEPSNAPAPQPAHPQVEKLQKQIDDCESRHAKLVARLEESREKTRSVSEEAAAHPETVVQRHIKLLHEYNEIRDVGQGLMGMIAEARGERLVDVQRQFGVSNQD